MPDHQLRDLVVQRCDITHALDEVIELEDLGLSDWPKTTSGKIRKVDLKQSLHQYRSKKERSSGGASSIDKASISESLVALWTRLLGVPTGRLTPSSSTTELADSLTTMRFKAQVQKDYGIQIELSEILQSKDIESQAKLVAERSDKSSSSASKSLPMLPTRSGPPSIEDMVHCFSDAKVFEQTRSAMAPILKSKGLSWEEDVEDVFPVYDMAHAFLQSRRPQSFNHRHAFATTASKETLQKAMHKAMTAHPLLRSLAFDLDSTTTLQATIRPSAHWFSLACSRKDGRVAAAEDLRTFELHNPSLDFAAPPGPLVRWMLVDIESTKTAGLVLQLNHAAFDGFSLPYFLEDLDAALGDSDSVTLPTRLHHKFFADAYYQHRTSAAAQTDISFFKSKLCGLAAHKDRAFWPPTRAPGRFHGSDAGWTHSDGTKGDASSRPSLDKTVQPRGVDQVIRRTKMPGLARLRSERSISPVIAALAAATLTNTHLTKADRAVFGAYEAARSWPFVPRWMADRLPDPLDVDGSTVESVVHCIPVDRTKPLGEFLGGLAEYQAGVAEHAHAPSRLLEEQLGDADGEAYRDALTRQVFNWIPGLAAEANGGDGPFKCLKRMQQQSRSDHVLRWTLGVLDDDVFHVGVAWDDAQMRMDEVESAIDIFVAVLSWVVEPENWEKSLADVKETLKAA